ncbi:MAG: basic amino acid ABC transporter substrate-binding protein [Desulfobacteraceae bacterium]|nr:basic amino acid ABC transporter substrate-binding protein [Desulfobacteraceae bacterium]
MKDSRIIRFAIGTLLAVTLAVGCGPKKDMTVLERIKDAGVMTVGVSPDYPPFESIDDKGNIIGFDIDLARAVAAELGVEAKFVNMGFDSIITAVKSGQVNVGISSFSINEERKASIDFSTPYLVSSQVVLVQKDSPLKTAEDLAGKHVAAAIGTTGAEAAKSIKDIELKIVDDNNLSVMMLSNGSADAVVIDVAIAKEYQKKLGFDIMEKPLQLEETACVIMKGNEDLTQEINKAIEKIKADGSFDTIKAKWEI